MIYIAKTYPEWQRVVLKVLQPLYNAETNTLPPNNDIMMLIKKEDKLSQVFKKVMPFVQYIKVSLPFHILIVISSLIQY